MNHSNEIIWAGMWTWPLLGLFASTLLAAVIFKRTKK